LPVAHKLQSLKIRAVVSVFTSQARCLVVVVVKFFGHEIIPNKLLHFKAREVGGFYNDVLNFYNLKKVVMLVAKPAVEVTAH